MFAGRSIQLARIFGIRVGASPSWFFVLFAGIYLLTGYFQEAVDGSSSTAFLLAVAAALLFFVSITLHELGHAIVARRNGIGTAGIDLIFFGGVAKLTRDAETPGAEFRIAAAGPLVTGLLVALCIGLGLGLSHAGDLFDAATFSDDNGQPIYALLGFLATINFALLIFNLVPAFPLDGGRIARAIAWKITGDRNRGTRFSGRAGQVFAFAMIGAGIYLLMQGDELNGAYTIILGFFLHQAASGAVLSSTFSDRIGGIRVADVMDNEPVTMPAGTPALAAEDEFFLRYRYPWFAVTDERGRYVGVLRREAAEEAVRGGRPATTAAELVEEEPDRFRIGRDQPLEALMGQPGLRDLGALMAVDAEGVLCGVITVEQIRRALTSAVT
ncbi:MAG: site-2 protease family protein [Solirubrobacteraceae bacterium]